MIIIDEQIQNIEKEIRETPYHKGTERHIGILRARIARLKDKQLEVETRSKKGGGGGGYAIKKEGNASVVLIGPPSVGKSTLLNKLTNANSKVAPYAFTTVSVIPGMMNYKDARIQILDVPGLIEGAEEGKGRGKEVLSVARGSNLLVIMTEVGKIDALERISKALQRNGIRLNQEKPKVAIEKKLGGGIIIHSNFKQEFDKETIKTIALEYGIKNAEITIKERLNIDRLIDSFSTSRVYIKAIYIVNKSDLGKYPKENIYKPLFISVYKNINLDILRDLIWDNLYFVRVYLVKPEKEPDFSNPIIAKKEDTLEDVGLELSSQFFVNKKGAKIWGTGAKFSGQEVSLKTKVSEGMQIRFI